MARTRIAAGLAAEDCVTGFSPVAEQPVVAVRRRVAGTGSGGTEVVGRTGIAVVARSRVVGIHATGTHIARIIRADVAVIAIRSRTTHARTSRTGVGRRTGIAVVARSRVVGVHATAARVAGVIRARIGVVTTQGRTGLTSIVEARLSAVARIPVITIGVGGATGRSGASRSIECQLGIQNARTKIAVVEVAPHVCDHNVELVWPGQRRVARFQQSGHAAGVGR